MKENEENITYLLHDTATDLEININLFDVKYICRIPTSQGLEITLIIILNQSQKGNVMNF